MSERKTNIRLPYQAVVIMLVISNIFALLMISSAVKRLSKREEKARRCTLETKAYCIQVDKVFRYTDDSSRSTIYYPVFRYKVDGKSYVSRSDTASSDKGGFVKDSYYTIKVDPNSPESFVYGDPVKGTRIAKRVFMGVGAFVTILFTVICIVIVIRSRRAERDSGYDDLYGGNDGYM